MSMPRSVLPCVSALSFVSLAWVGSVQAQLAATSPFLPAGAAPAAAAPVVESGVLELRGVLPTPTGRLFSIYNTTRRMSTYVALNETGSWGSGGGGSFVVRSHRQIGDQDQVTVDFQGQTLTLSTKSPKVAVTGRGGATAPAATVTPATPATRGGGGGAAPAGFQPAGAGGGRGAGGAGGGRGGAAGGRGGPAGAAGGAVAADGPVDQAAATSVPISVNQAASLAEDVAARQRARAEALANPAAATAPAVPAQPEAGARGGRGARGGN